MRKFLPTIALLAIAMISLTFSSCKKDNSQSTANKLIGKWYIKTVVSNETFSGVPQSNTENHTDNHDYYEFKADGSLIMIESDTEGTSPWVIKNGKLILGYGIDTSYGNIITTYDIYELSNSTLRLHRTASNESWTIDQTITFTKEI